MTKTTRICDRLWGWRMYKTRPTHPWWNVGSVPSHTLLLTDMTTLHRHPCLLGVWEREIIGHAISPSERTVSTQRQLQPSIGPRHLRKVAGGRKELEACRERPEEGSGAQLVTMLTAAQGLGRTTFFRIFVKVEQE